MQFISPLEFCSSLCCAYKFAIDLMNRYLEYLALSMWHLLWSEAITRAFNFRAFIFRAPEKSNKSCCFIFRAPTEIRGSLIFALSRIPLKFDEIFQFRWCTAIILSAYSMFPEVVKLQLFNCNYSWLSLSQTPSISNLSLSRTKVSVPLCKL